MDNIKNLIKRIGAEAETVEDMEQLLLSELDAYEKFKNNHSGKIKLYEQSEIIDKYAIVGDLEGCAIALQQKLVKGTLKSKYREYYKI